MLGQWMETEIGEQPWLLRENAAAYEDQLKSLFQQKRYEMVLLAARGSSDHAALYARYLIEIHLQIPACLAAPSVITNYGKTVKYPKCLAIGISQSGAAPDVAEVLTALRAQGHDTLAITNTPESRITEAAGETLLLNAGPERSVAATKTYTTSLLALAQLVRALGGDLPDPVQSLPDERWLEAARAQANVTSHVLVESQPAFSLARGYNFATALEGALKLMECALIPCKGYSVADFQHGPRALAGPGSCAIVYDQIQTDLESQGCAVVEAPDTEATHPAFAPLSSILFGQWLALTAARLKGLNPDDPQFIHKVTETR